ncbi:MAG: GspH/FimT family pseudopilin [Betaproteobacteria bacterium]
MKRTYGFSLIELIVVITIIGFLMAIGVPAFMTWLRNVQIRNGAEAIMNGMQTARMEALRRNERVTFWLVSLTDPRVMDNSCARSTTGSSWVVSRDDPASLCATVASDTTAPRIIQTKAAGDGNINVSITAVDASGTGTSCITFNGFGRPEAKCSDLAASEPIVGVDVVSSQADSNTRNFSIRVSAGGDIRMCDPAVKNAADPRVC